MCFSLNSNKDTYEWNERSLYGELFIKIYDITFPDKDWIDIISSVLNMWTDNIISLLKSNLNREEEFHFMDGPYYFVVTSKKNELIKITLFEKNKQVNEKPYEIMFYNFLSEISKIIVDLINDERLKEVKNINDLRRKYINLEKYIKIKGYMI